MRQLNGGVIAARAAALREKGVAALKAHLASAQGRRIQVLMESDGQGRAADFTAVKIEAQGAGHIVDAVVNGHDGAALLAVVQT
jgi:threonylcarbamoyladenosine tRNA methylthiotransferase MtaB